MPWQQLAADVALEVEEDGTFSYRTVIIHVQRQAGKTTLFGPVACHRALTTPYGETWLTAQRRQDARDIWVKVVERVKASALKGAVEIRESNGGESLTFPGGGTFRVFAPSEDALHGKANHVVGIDEAWSFTREQGLALEQAILPTFTTTGGQLWIFSTAGTADSAWFEGFVQRGRLAVESGRRNGIAFFEWSLADEDVAAVTEGLGTDASPADRAHALGLVLAAHPAAGHTLRPDALEQAADTMGTPGFLRAYCNRWSETSDATIPGHAWSAARRPVPAPSPGRVALGFDVALDRSDACIAAAWRDTDDGPLYVDIIDHRPGAGWLPDRMRELDATWGRPPIGHDLAGPALAPADALRNDGLRLVGTSAREYATACAAWLGELLDGRMFHPGDPALDAAVAVAATRKLGEAWAWSRRSSAASIAPLVAVTQAAYALGHAEEPMPAPLIYSGRL